MSIYVTLPSNGGGQELTNTNASFKVRLPERLKLKHEPWEVALASISLPTLEANNLLKKFPPTTQVGSLSGLLAYEEKDAPPGRTTNPTKVRAVQDMVTMDQVMKGGVKDGVSFVRNLVIQLQTQLNVARQTKIADLKTAGTTVFNPRWRHKGGEMDGQPYEQTLVLGEDDLGITGNYPNTYIYTAIHDDLALALGLVQSKTDATPGPSTTVSFQTDLPPGRRSSNPGGPPRRSWS